MTDYIDQLTAMHMNTQKGHTSPHKAVMLPSAQEMPLNKKGGCWMRSGAFSLKTTIDGNANPVPRTIDIRHNMRILTISTPAKPLPSMLNSGGFFFFGGFQE